MTTLASFRTALAESFYDAIAGGETNLFFFVGRPHPWDVEEEPDVVVDTQPYLNSVRNDMVFLKKINTSDCKFMVTKREWTTGTVYDQYDDDYGNSVTYPISSVSGDTLNGSFDLSEFGEGWLVEGTNIAGNTHVLSATTTGITLDTSPLDTDVTEVTITNVSTSNESTLKDAEFYVVTTDLNVYKCLDNAGGGESTVEPTLVQVEPFAGIDGYRWKYLFTVPESHMDEFGTVSMMPVGAAITSSGTGIHAIKVMHGGTGYTTPTTTVTIDGDGSGATATATVVDGAVTAISVTSPGSGYSYATLTISSSGAGSGAAGRAILSPIGGHGAFPVRELCSTALRLSKELDAGSVSETNNGFVIGNDYRQTGLIKDPLVFEGYTKYTDSLASACWVITGPFSYGDVAEDDIITDTDGKRFRVVSKPPTEPVGDVDLLVQSLDGVTPDVGTRIEYAESNADLTAVTPPDIDKYSGMLLLVDNREAYEPTDEQLISFKSTLNF